MVDVDDEGVEEDVLPFDKKGKTSASGCSCDICLVGGKRESSTEYLPVLGVMRATCATLELRTT